MRTSTSEIVIWSGGIFIAGLMAYSATLGLRTEPTWVQSLCSKDKAIVPAALISGILSEIAAPDKAAAGDAAATRKADCIFHVAGAVRLTDQTGVQRDRTFEGDVRVLPIPSVWANVSVSIY